MRALRIPPNPCAKRECITKAAKRFRFCELGDGAPGKDEFSLPERLAQPVYELGAKDGAEHVHRQEEVVLRMRSTLDGPAAEPSGRDHAVNVGVQV